MRSLRLAFALLSAAACLSVRAAEPAPATPAADAPSAAPAPRAPAEGEPKTREEAFAAAGVKLVAGPTMVPLGKVAELKLPPGFSFVGPDSLDRFYALTQNQRSGREVGVVMAPNDWMLFLDYDDIGYVKDEDKDELDADKLMTAMTANEAEVNEARQQRGWDALKITGWATKPYYDEKTNNLKWAINLSSSQDNFKSVWINESIRILGRGGVMNATLVTDTANFKAAEAAADQLLADNYGYITGEKYSEFKAGDKVAAYGLGALVLGGAGVMAAKAGLFGKLGALFAKMGKLVIIPIIAIGAGIKKLWDRFTGSRRDKSPFSS